MRNTRNEKINKGIIIIMILLIVGILLLTYNIIENKNIVISKKNLEIKNIETSMKKSIQLAEKPSKIERLGGNAEAFRRMSELNLAGIKNLEEKYEFNILTYVCLKEQVNRLMNNENVDEEFCSIKTNLEQFRSKK